MQLIKTNSLSFTEINEAQTFLSGFLIFFVGVLDFLIFDPNKRSPLGMTAINLVLAIAWAFSFPYFITNVNWSELVGAINDAIIKILGTVTMCITTYGAYIKLKDESTRKRITARKRLKRKKP